MLKIKRFVVLNGNTHMSYDESNNQVVCTHGGWGGTLEMRAGLFYVGNATAESCVFTNASSLDEAISEGITSISGSFENGNLRH